MAAEARHAGQGLQRAREEADLGYGFDVVGSVLDDDAVAVEKNGGARGHGPGL
jgi:hypothetical protein